VKTVDVRPATAGGRGDHDLDRAGEVGRGPDLDLQAVLAALTDVAATPPKVTEVTPVSPVPTMVTLVPPEAGPVAG